MWPALGSSGEIVQGFIAFNSVYGTGLDFTTGRGMLPRLNVLHSLNIAIKLRHCRNVGVGVANPDPLGRPLLAMLIRWF